MKLTFVLKEDILEACGAAVALFSLYVAWRDHDLTGVAFALIFGVGSGYFYQKKNRARWCERCQKVMAYGAEESASSSDFDVVYTCRSCGRRNRAGIATGRGKA